MLKMLQSENRAQVAACSQEQGQGLLGEAKGKWLAIYCSFLAFLFLFALPGCRGQGRTGARGGADNRAFLRESVTWRGGHFSSSYHPTE